MTRALHPLKVGLTAILIAMLAVALAGFTAASDAGAQSPPTPPSRFAGQAFIDGELASPGTEIIARIAGETCGVTQVDSDGNYVIDVSAFEPGNNNCGAVDDDITFFVGGLQATETGAWKNFELTLLDLNAQTPTPTPTEGPTDEESTPTATPVGPDTGSAGLASASSGSSAGWLVAVAGLMAIALGSTGFAVVRRQR